MGHLEQLVSLDQLDQLALLDHQAKEVILDQLDLQVHLDHKDRVDQRGM